MTEQNYEFENEINNPLPPRPDFLRLPLQTLNGDWYLRLDEKNEGLKHNWNKDDVQKYNGRIIVPFPIESQASGVGLQYPPDVFWYYRNVELPEAFIDSGLLLHFGAVDYEATVFWNGEELGRHAGGYSSFSFPVFGNLIRTKNILCVRVKDAKCGGLPRGKQTAKKDPWAVFYRQTSGIWQSIWMEKINTVWIDNVLIRSNYEARSFNVIVRLKSLSGNNSDSAFDLRATLHFNIEKDPTLTDPHHFQKRVSSTNISVKGSRPINFSLEVGEPHFWSPEEPHLYCLELALHPGVRSEQENALDRVHVVCGFRSITTRDGRVYLNKKLLYQKLLLNQGYYPEGDYTAIDENIYRRDLLAVKNCGFNGIRIHEKIEDPRFLYLCDRIGLVAWEEMPSPAIFSWVNDEAFFREWQEIIERDRNHPSIICRVVFNESWGVFRTLWNRGAREILKKGYDFTKKHDPDTLCIDNSGFDHLRTDLIDIHHYLKSEKKIRNYYAALKQPETIPYRVWRILYLVLTTSIYKAPFLPGGEYTGQPVIISEMGGYGFYESFDKGSLLLKIEAALTLISDYLHIQGFCYTQQYDVEQEKNGIFTFDRQPRVDLAELRRIVDNIFQKKELIDKSSL